VDAVGLFTSQIGYAWNNVLWYVKGGAAVTDNTYSSFFASNGVVFNQTTQTGWGGAVGTGLDLSFAQDWSIGFEYDHLFMGHNTVTFAPTAIAVGCTDTIGQNVGIGTVRVNYRFGGPVISKY
jgi:outer membrane immunogenic protein